MSGTEPFVAATRFGLGARPGELGALASGPREWLRAQVDGGDPEVEARLANLPSSAAGVRQMVAMRGASDELRQVLKTERRHAFAAEQGLLLAATAASATPFRERLVAFWANHFTVSITSKEVAGVAAAFEREVVRRHLDGTFEDLLVASTRSPAMLAYLDNVRSIGPSSPAGRRTGRGLNENLAREVLELHTLGVNGGYGQADVEALARLLTGWSIDLGGGRAGGTPAPTAAGRGGGTPVPTAAGRAGGTPAPTAAGRGGGTPAPTDGGAFVFYPNRHEPGAVTLLGRRYAKGTEQDGLDALRALARHPATARHVATKLARAFVADDPPASAVANLEAAFRASGGHLPTVHRALVELDEAWADPLAKVKTPWDLVISTRRALDPSGAMDSDGQRMLRSLRFLGQLPYQAPSPKGWPDDAASWAGPEAVLARLEWAEEVARHAQVADVPALAADVLGPMLSARTATALRSAGTRGALATLIGCPEFQRR